LGGRVSSVAAGRDEKQTGTFPRDVFTRGRAELKSGFRADAGNPWPAMAETGFPFDLTDTPSQDPDQVEIATPGAKGGAG
jgi:hypothetical protein